LRASASSGLIQTSWSRSDAP